MHALAKAYSRYLNCSDNSYSWTEDKRDTAICHTGLPLERGN